MSSSQLPTSESTEELNEVFQVKDVGWQTLEGFVRALDMELVRVMADQAIPGSFWGNTEAGLIGNRLYARADTPLHSVLHESCHWLCMDEARRAALHTNAGGDYAEENAVCYLQLLLADRIPGFGRERCAVDMDIWGYSFRLGSAQRWFEEDAEDARAWLRRRGLITADGTPQI